MRNTFCFLVMLIILAACKKEEAANSLSPAPKIMLADATVVSKGDLVFSSGTVASGLAKIYRQTDGYYVLGLENLGYKTPYDLHVYLSKTPFFTDASVKLFSTLNFSEDVYYLIVGGVQIKAYNYIVVQKDASMGPIAVAKLQ